MSSQEAAEEVMTSQVVDVLSILQMLCENEPEDLARLRSISRCVYKLLLRLFGGERFNYKFRQCLTENVLTFASFTMTFPDIFIFRLIFLNSLKFKKSLLSDDDDPEETTSFLNFVMRETFLTIQINRPSSAALLRLIHAILLEKPDILVVDLAWVTLKSMMHVSTSGIASFKKSALDISRLCLEHPEVKGFLRNFNKMEFKGVDYHHLLMTVYNEDIIDFPDRSNDEAFALFANNVNSRDGSILYEAILNHTSFEDFLNKIWVLQEKHIIEQTYDTEGELHQSLFKYWIPLNVKFYKNDFYTRIRCSQIPIILKAKALLELKRYCCDLNIFESDTDVYLHHPKTKVMGLKILCTFKKHVFPNTSELNTVKKFLLEVQDQSLSCDIAKCIRQVISQIFFIIHSSGENAMELDLKAVELYKDFLNWVYAYCINIFDENYEFASQLLLIIWKIATGSSKQLTTDFRIERNDEYSTGQNLFYKFLKSQHFWDETLSSAELISKIDEFVKIPRQNIMTSPTTSVELIVNYYLDKINLGDEDISTIILESLSSGISIHTLENYKLFARLILKYKILNEIDLDSDLESLKNYFEKCKSTKSEDLFISTLILEVICITLETHVVDFLTPLLEDTVSFIRTIFEENVQDELDFKSIKVLESYINAYLHLLRLSHDNWKHCRKDIILDGLAAIIEKSQLKRPVATAIRTLKDFSDYFVTFEERKLFLQQLLDNTRTKRTSKIRRHSEMSLMIQSICQTEQDLRRPLLHKSLIFFSGTLFDVENDQGVDVALHCCEVLINDSTLQYATLKYIPRVTYFCVQHFNNQSWVIRNGAIQLLRSLVDRFLGVKQEDGKRTKSIVDFFGYFPDIAQVFLDVLSKDIEGGLDDSALAVLTFFSESHIKENPLDVNVRQPLDTFKSIFVNIIKNHSDHLGEAAGKSLTSLCLPDEIPEVLLDLLRFITTNRTKIKRNIFKNILLYAGLLYQKLAETPIRDEYNFNVIKIILSHLFESFESDESCSLDLLAINLRNTSQSLILVDISTGENRVKLFNHIRFLARSIEFEPKYIPTLKFYLSNNEINDQGHVSALSILVERFANDRANKNRVNAVIDMLLNLLENVGKSRTYVVNSYCQAILTIYKFSNKFSLKDTVPDLDTNNLYRILVYLICYPFDVLLKDATFLQRAVNICLDNLIVDDELILFEISRALLPLLGLSLFIYDLEVRMKIFKLACLLLFQSEIVAFETIKFIRIVSNNPRANTLLDFLKPENLCRFFDQRNFLMILFLDIFNFVDAADVEDIPNKCLMLRNLMIFISSLQ